MKHDARLRAWAPGALGLLCAALSLAPETPLLRLALAGPLLFALPGQPWAALLPLPDRLGRALAGVWISLAALWLQVGLWREAAATPLAAHPAGWHLALLASSGVIWLAGAVVAARRPPATAQPTPGAGLGLIGVLVGVFAIATLRAADWTRPLADHWYLAEAERVGALPAAGPPQAPGPADPFSGPAPEAGQGGVLSLVLEGAAAVERGWPGAGAHAAALGPGPQTLQLRAPQGATGAVVIALQGPVGSELRVKRADGAPAATASIAAAVVEQADEGPVARYRDAGVAALRLPVDLAAGQALQLEAQPAGDGAPMTLFWLAGPEAVWSLHAEGGLRFVHYYQLLNQVENLDWAAHTLTHLRLVWNQPPGWTPLLAAAGAVAGHDLPTAGLLFLGVLVLLGAQSVAALLAAAPDAPPLARLLPGALVSAHGLLMLEPGSHDFPDSLYAAAVMAAAAALLRGELRAWAALALGAQALRWPGLTFALLLALAVALRHPAGLRAGLRRLQAGLGTVAVGLGAMVGLTALAVASGDAEDLLFVLYFETFPEHWHGETAPSALFPRVPQFFGLLVAYTGGTAAALVPAALTGPQSSARRAAQGILLGGLAYAALLATIDHHPTHYFLPLVALCGPALGAAVTGRGPIWTWGVPAACLLGLARFVAQGQV